MSEKERQIKNEAIRLIARLYKDLYLSEEVIHHGSGNKYDKLNNITSYLDKLESVHNKVSETNRHIEYLRQRYYDRYVIKREDIPMSYYRHQQEIALERGLGHIELTKEKRREIQDKLIQNQKASLDAWLNYFLSKDASVYPFWAKYWAFQGMLKLGVYDKEKGVFHKRSKETVEPFADLNREALAMSIDLVTEMLGKKIEDKKPKSEEEKRELSELEILIRNGSFPKIYSYVLRNLLRNNKNIIKRNTGIWVKYNQGSGHMPLVKSLQGYNTGWCTAGVSTAEMQLKSGDFYVYYTLDENDKYKVPRIAIRMEGNKIAEIRGIAKDQNLEPEMEEVVEEKLKEFPDKEEYYKKVSDMKELTKIYKKYKNNIELTKEELRFIYEIDSDILGFGYKKDPRIEEIISERNSERKDLALVFDCTEAEIALNKDEIKQNTIYLKDLDLNNIMTTNNLILPKYLKGNLFLLNLTYAENVIFPEIITESLYLNNLIKGKNIKLPKIIKGNLFLDSLTSIDGIIFPEVIGGDLNLGSLKEAKGLILPENIKTLYLNNLRSIENITLPKNVQSINLEKLESAKGLILPNNMAYLSLISLQNAKDLILLKRVSNLYLSGLTTIDNLLLPEHVEYLHLDGITYIEDYTFPDRIKYLNLSNLIHAKNLILPKYVENEINLSQLRYADNIVLPLDSKKDLYLTNLSSIDGLIFPKSLNYKVHMNGFTITPENINNYHYTRKK